ncbi:hypothetical protein BpHYR1_002202 [Brachionus plicatilis]|uniref:Uncharacterized protein n=1 Tax=Brachionus plicatilis TaxID=10195 RepID=A0A3M7R1P5_BRAPC|nr:hypothetical protein BpHYR1_002202 [Brachionus plicatilis]
MPWIDCYFRTHLKINFGFIRFEFENHAFTYLLIDFSLKNVKQKQANRLALQNDQEISSNSLEC